MSNPTPPSPDNHSPKPPATNAALRAVLTGVCIDVCGTTLLGLVIQAIYAAVVSTPDMTPAQLEEAVGSISPQSPLIVLGMLLGSLISVAAGYVCARIARRDEYSIGAIMAGCTTLVNLALDGGGNGPLDLELLYVLCSIACAMLGVMYGAAQNRRLAAPASPPADTSAP